MNRSVVLAMAALLIAGCSQETPQPSPQGASSPPASPADVPQASTGAVGGMQGEVSGLSADRSGLNVRITDFGKVVDLPSDALFAYDKAELTPEAETELRKVADLIRESPQGPIQIIGHTDSHGEDAYNQTLSEARARTVAGWFGQQVGVRTRSFEVAGRGETRPIAPNVTATGADDPVGRAKNRRVEVVVPKG